MNSFSWRSGRSGIAGSFFVLIALTVLVNRASAQPGGPPAVEQGGNGPQTDMRWGGALEQSYQYHRQGPNGNLISPATGWHHYGFPVPSYRWGWFGAARYYPRTLWHEGFYGDKCRWAYRSGY